jgi:cellobiose-specific phosphotransferase system component IIC
MIKSIYKDATTAAYIKSHQIMHFMKYVVLGGTGMMGRIAVRDLFESDQKNEIVIAALSLNPACRRLLLGPALYVW